MDKYSNNNDIYVYEFGATDINKKNDELLKKFNLTPIGYVRHLFDYDYVNYAVKGSLEDLNKFANYISYELHPDYLCLEADFDYDNRDWLDDFEIHNVSSDSDTPSLLTFEDFEKEKPNFLKNLISYAKNNNFEINNVADSPVILLLPTGMLISAADSSTHTYFIEDFIRTYYLDGTEWEDDTNIISSLADEVLDFIEEYEGVITLNAGTTWAENRAKIVISRKPTDAQFEKIAEFLDYMYLNHYNSTIWIFTDDYDYIRYRFSEKVTPEYILNAIKDKFGRLGFLENLSEDIEVHDSLNPKLWNEDNTLKEEVKEKIYEIVSLFKTSLNDNDIDIDIKDIYLLGSNTSYNYNENSDLDVHIIVNLPESEEAQYQLNTYLAHASIFNKNHDIKFFGVDVEIYVVANDVQAKSNGVYSLTDGWIKFPNKKDILDIDTEQKHKVEKMSLKLEKTILDTLNSDNLEDVIELLHKIYSLRRDSIKKDGEYALGNLVFKELRNKNLIQQLKDKKTELETRSLSLEKLISEEASSDFDSSTKEIDTTSIFKNIALNNKYTTFGIITSDNPILFNHNNEEKSKYTLSDLTSEIHKIFGRHNVIIKKSLGHYSNTDETSLFVVFKNNNLNKNKIIKNFSSLAKKYGQESFIIGEVINKPSIVMYVVSNNADNSEYKADYYAYNITIYSNEEVVSKNIDYTKLLGTDLYFNFDFNF